MTQPRCEVIGDCTLYCGDALTLLPTLFFADIMLTDPPFAAQTHAGARTRTEGAESRKLVPYAAWTDDHFVTFCRRAVAQTRRWVVLFCDWRHAALLEPAALPLVRLGVWVKPNSAPQLSGDRPSPGWEAIALLHGPGRKMWNGGGGRAVWTYNRVDAVNHPNEKPVLLLMRLLSEFSQPGDLVSDLCMGSGSTGVACVQQGLRFVGCELDPHYFDLACRRIEAAYKQPDLFVPPPPAVAPVQPGLWAQKETL